MKAILAREAEARGITPGPWCSPRDFRSIPSISPAICAGKTFAGRVAGSLLQAVGLGDLVTTSLEEYEALALRQRFLQDVTIRGVMLKR